MATIEERTIRLPLYLEVLQRMPGVELGDIDQTKSVFGDAFVRVPPRIRVSRGDDTADGVIHINRLFRSPPSTELVVTDDGHVERASTFFQPIVVDIFTSYDGAPQAQRGDSLPERIAPYFFGGFFGVSELPEGVELWKQVGADLAFRLYRCAEQTGDVDRCMRRHNSTPLRLALEDRDRREKEYREQLERESLERRIAELRERYRRLRPSDGDHIAENLSKNSANRLAYFNALNQSVAVEEQSRIGSGYLDAKAQISSSERREPREPREPVDRTVSRGDKDVGGRPCRSDKGCPKGHRR